MDWWNGDGEATWVVPVSFRRLHGYSVDSCEAKTPFVISSDMPAFFHSSLVLDISRLLRDWVLRMRLCSICISIRGPAYIGRCTARYHPAPRSRVDRTCSSDDAVYPREYDLSANRDVVAEAKEHGRENRRSSHVRHNCRARMPKSNHAHPFPLCPPSLSPRK